MKQASFEPGVVLLDQPDYPLTSGGIAVSAAGRRRFSSYNDLPTAVTWWTNVTFQKFKSELMYRRPNARNDQLLRMPQSQILQELGLGAVSAPDQAEALFQVLNETVCFVHEQLNPCPAPFQRLDWHFAPLVRALSRDVIGGDFSSLVWAARDAHAYVSASASVATRYPQMRTYIAPRGPRLEQILRLPAPAPTTSWRWFRHPERVDSKRLWAIAGPVALVEISVSNPDEMVSQVAPFGVGARKGASQRLWAPLPEAMWYADRCDMDLVSVWQASEAAPVGASLHGAISGDWRKEFSFSAAIVSEALLYTLLGTTASPAPPTGREPLAAYVAGYDRLQMIQLAMKITRAGHPALSASCGGRVVVGVTPQSIAEVDEFCLRLGLEPPMGAAN